MNRKTHIVEGDGYYYQFFEAAKNEFGIELICPANSGMAYGVTEGGQYALLYSPSCTNQVTGVIMTAYNFDEVRDEFFARK